MVLIKSMNYSGSSPFEQEASCLDKAHTVS